MRLGKVRLIFLLALSSFVSVAVLLAFHIYTKIAPSFLALDFFSGDSTLGIGFLIAVIAVLAILQISMVSMVRIRNCSVPVLCYFMKKGVHFRFLKAVIFCFLTCMISFLMGLSLGGEAPSVFMSAVIFAYVFSFSEESEERLLRAIKVGSCVGFSLAFMNPIAGILYSFVPDKFEKGYFKKEYKPIIEGVVCALVSYFLYGALKGLIFYGDYEGAFYKAFLFSDFQSSVLNLSIASLKRFWIPFLIAPLSMLCGYLYVHGLGFLRRLLWKEKGITYVFSVLGAIVLIPLCRYYSPLSLGGGAKIIEENASLLANGLAGVAILFAIRLGMTAFSLTSHFSGGNIIPSLAIGMLLGTILGGLLKLALPLSEEELTLISFCFMLSFFSATSNKRLSVFALTISFGPSPSLVLSLLPSLALSYLCKRKLKSFKSLSNVFAASDISNSSYARTLWRHYPYCSPMFEEVWERRVLDLK